MLKEYQEALDKQTKNQEEKMIAVLNRQAKDYENKIQENLKPIFIEIAKINDNIQKLQDSKN